MSDIIINKVAESGIITLDLEDFYPKEELVIFDIKEYLFMGMVLKEKDFRTALQQLDWSAYTGKLVAVTCSVDAIVPYWAYMLITAYLQPLAADIVFGDEKAALQQRFLKNIAAIDVDAFNQKRVVIKGCGDLPIGEFAYMEITKKLRPVVKSLMYGEPCSTVPIYKKK